MEDVSAILMYVDAFNLLGVYVSCNVRSLVNDKNRLVVLCGLVGKYCPV